MDDFDDLYRRAAGAAALCEIKLRMLADKTPELEELALDQKLENIEKRLSVVFAHCLTGEETALLERSRQLRNKLLHADFCEARDRLAKLGVPARRGGVRRIVLADTPGTSMLEKLQPIAAGTVGRPVADTPSTKEGSIVGWFFELATSGDLHEAIKIFDLSVGPLIDRLADEADRLSMTRSSG